MRYPFYLLTLALLVACEPPPPTEMVWRKRKPKLPPTEQEIAEQIVRDARRAAVREADSLERLRAITAPAPAGQR